jgi:hypothetical protein
MAQPIPKTTKQWNVTGIDGFDSLRYTEQPVPELGDNMVLVKCKSSTFPVYCSGSNTLCSQNKLTGAQYEALLSM